MDAHCVGGIHAFVTSGLDWHNALCLSSSQGPAAICAMCSCLIPINILLMQSACMLGKTRGLDHCHLRFCLVRVLSSWQITWDWEMAIPIFGNCPGCMVKGFDSWFIWAVHEAKPEWLTIMAYHNSQLFIRASNRMGCAWGSRFWGAGGRCVFVLMLHL